MHFPAIIQDLAVILGVAAVVTFLFRRIRQPVVLGYVVAGIIVGPHTPAIFSVRDTANIKVWAEIGVIFLMFTLGLEFSFRRLGRVGLSAGVTAIVQILVMLVLGIVSANLLGWSKMDAVFLGCMIAISSTTIIIKAFEELGLKSKKFAEVVFGILIVEDLAAILMLVALTNIATTSQVGGMELLLAGGNLLLVIGVWFLVGMFLVPRFINSVSRHGNDEMLTVVAIGLCLALAAVAAFFHYSVALGAFIMGSILAESAEAKRIEHLVLPLKDLFGAVFFVSVGMLLDPKVIIENIGAVAVISAVIIVGKLGSVTVASFLTGQSVANSLRTGFSMGQIGEFSFIIGSLGLSYDVVGKQLYPTIVAVSLVTTFTTPYLIRASAACVEMVEARIPDRVAAILDNYVSWVQRRTVSSESRKILVRCSIKWILNAIVVITVFTLGAEKLLPIGGKYLSYEYAAPVATWLVACVLAAPSIWAMFSAFREVQGGRDWRLSLPGGGTLLLSRVVTVGLVGLLSSAYFPATVTLLATVGIFALLLALFRRQVEGYYRWFEHQFSSSFQADLNGGHDSQPGLDRLAPWDAHLVEVKVPARSFLVGRPLHQLRLREHYGINVVVLLREGESIVAPGAGEILYPSDRILCFATDQEVERFRQDLQGRGMGPERQHDSGLYDIRKMKIQDGSSLSGLSIRQSGIMANYGCIVVGVERGSERSSNPSSDRSLAVGDVLWVVGERSSLQGLLPAFG